MEGGGSRSETEGVPSHRSAIQSINNSEGIYLILLIYARVPAPSKNCENYSHCNPGHGAPSRRALQRFLQTSHIVKPSSPRRVSAIACGWCLEHRTATIYCTLCRLRSSYTNFKEFFEGFLYIRVSSVYLRKISTTGTTTFGFVCGSFTNTFPWSSFLSECA